MIKPLLISIYWCISLVALCAEPSTKSIFKMLLFFALALSNMALATYLVNKQMKKFRTNATSTNRN